MVVRGWGRGSGGNCGDGEGIKSLVGKCWMYGGMLIINNAVINFKVAEKLDDHLSHHKKRNDNNVKW